MGDERLTFAPVVESLFSRIMGQRLSAATRARLQLEGLDLERPLLPAYPAGLVARWIELALPDAFPGQPREEALRLLGHETLSPYSQTLLGKALVGLLRMVGLRRTLQRMTQAMRTGGNYLETRCTVHGPADVELWVNDTNRMPTYFLGVLEGMAALCGEKARVQLDSVDGVSCTLRVRWDG